MGGNVAIMRKLLMFLLFCSWGCQAVLGAACSAEANFTCVATDFTLQSCDMPSQTCDCKQGYKPIPSGCTKQLQQPTVQLEEGRTKEFLPGATVKLTCATSDDGSLTYEWIKDGMTVHNSTEPEFEISGSDADKTGRFSCVVKDISLSLESDESTIVEIIPLNVLDNTVLPRVSDLPVFVVPGGDLHLRCLDIPVGANYTFRINSATTTTTEVTQNSTNTNITCVLDDVPGVTYRNKESVSVQWTTHDATQVTRVGLVSTPIMLYHDPVSVNLTCLTEPEDKYLKVGNTTVKYNLALQIRGGGMFRISMRYYHNTILLNFSHPNSSDDDVNITCIANYKYHTAESTFLRINFSDSNVTVPVLRASSAEVPAGSRLVLTCGEPQQQVTYIWYKDRVQIPRQLDRIIQFNDFQPTDAGNFTCTAVGGSYQAASQKVEVQFNDTSSAIS